MPRTPRGPIDLLVGYTEILAADPPDPPELDHYLTEDGKYTIWGVGLITFGPPTPAQQAWIADPSNYSNLSSFPTDWVSFGFPMTPLPAITLWEFVNWVKNQVLLTEQGITGADDWSIGGQTGTGTFYWSDVSVTNGTNAGETLTGTNVAETLNGLGGDDTLIGGGGSDALHGGPDNDHLIGGPGIDRLWGDDGNDILEPGSDAAFIYIEGGVSREGVYSVDGGPGFDTLVLDYSAATQSQSISGAQALASDQVVDVEAVKITGSQFSDFLIGSSDADQLFGGGGFDYLSGGGGNDTLDAGAPGASPVATIGPGGHSNADALSLDHLFVAGSGFPSVSFSIKQVETKVSEDWGLRPPAGNIYSFTVGEAGDQALIDYTVDDELGDVVEFHITDANGVPVWDWILSDPPDPLLPIVFPEAGTYYLEVIIFHQNIWDTALINVTLSLEGADVLASNVLEGGTGDDTYFVYSASDQVVENSGEGNDTIRSSVNLTLADNVENLILTGSAAINGIGNELGNQLTGNGGRNVLVGGDGADTLRGGAAADIFVFTESELGTTRMGPHDVIADWQRGDRIDISALYEGVMFNGLKSGKAADVNTLSGFRAITYTEGGKTYLSGDTNGIAGADFTIELTGKFKLKSGDLIVSTGQWNQATGGLDYDAYHDEALWLDTGII